MYKLQKCGYVSRLNGVLDMKDKGNQILADESVCIPKFVDRVCNLIVYINS